MRLIATDLDGTLLRRDETISARTGAVLKRITAEGGHVALVTGRPLRWLAGVYAQLPVAIPAVCANGAVVYDPDSDTAVHTAPLLPRTLAEVCRRLRAEVPDVAFAVEVEDGRSMRHEHAYPLRWDNADPAVRALATTDELFARPAVKLLARAGDRDPDAFAEVVSGCIAGLAEATHSSYSGLVEISAVGVTKAAGLAWLCERIGVDRAEVLAFGDMPNDLPMLTWAGRSVAVANAHAAVLAVADDVAPSNDEDGVAAYLELLLDQGP
jgi:Cof subfamily protein (haloacid dehalogenase superfamily)